MKALGIVFILAIFILTIASVKTAIPESNGMKNLIGYKSCCPFAPASTAIGLAAAVILFFAARSLTLF